MKLDDRIKWLEDHIQEYLRLMKNKNGMDISNNVQTTVDSETQLITDYLVMAPTAEFIKQEAGDRIIEAVADKGYEQVKDMAACLEKGIIPNVILPMSLRGSGVGGICERHRGYACTRSKKEDI